MIPAMVSIIVCTFNRAELLTCLLRSVLRLQTPECWTCELLIVDNRCTDKTQAIVDSFRCGLPIRYLYEGHPGKTHALNTGLAAARGDLLLFTDDDVVLDSSWLSAYVEAARARSESGWFGGRIFPNWPESRPTWLRDECLPALSGYFGLYDLGDDSRPYGADDKPPAGASMAVRRTTFERIGLFREDLGPLGSILGGTGDDTELLSRARQAGIPGYYVSDALCAHHVSPDRLKMSSFLRYGVGKGASQAKMLGDARPKGSCITIAEQTVRGVLQIFRGRRDRAAICALNVGMQLGYRRR